MMPTSMSILSTSICLLLLQIQCGFGANESATIQSTINDAPRETELQPQFDGPENSTANSTSPPTAQLAKPPSSGEQIGTTPTTASIMKTNVDENGKEQSKKSPIVVRQSPPPPPIPFADSIQQQPFAPLKPESKGDWGRILF